MGQIKYQMEGKKDELQQNVSNITQKLLNISCLEVESDMKGFVLGKQKNPIVQYVYICTYLQEC